MFDYKEVLKTEPMKFRLSDSLVSELQQWSKVTNRDMGDIANGALKSYKANPQGFISSRRKYGAKDGSQSMNWRIRSRFVFEGLDSSTMEQVLLWHINNAKENKGSKK